VEDFKVEIGNLIKSGEMILRNLILAKGVSDKESGIRVDKKPKNTL